MEGESLLNDATSLVLFSVFLDAVAGLRGGAGGGGDEGKSVTQLLPGMAMSAGRLTAGGAAVGLIMGWVTLFALRRLRRSGAESAREFALIQAAAFLTFYLADAALDVSGTIAVVTFGLYGASTSKFELDNIKLTSDLDAVQGTLATAFNGIAFFLGGATAANFLLRAAPALRGALVGSAFAAPAIFVALFAVRGVSAACINAALGLVGIEPLKSWSMPFITWGGLRGSLSLIMVMVVAAQQAHHDADDPSSAYSSEPGDDQQLVTAQILAWTSAVVLCTMLVNAPTLPAVLRRCGLLEVAPAKARILRSAFRSLSKRTEEAIEDLKADEDELLRGVDWVAVRRFVNIEADAPGVSTLSSESSQEGVVLQTPGLGRDMSKRASRGALLSVDELAEGLAAASDVDENEEDEEHGIGVARTRGLEHPLLRRVAVDVSTGTAAQETEAPFLSSLRRLSAGATDTRRSSAAGPSLGRVRGVMEFSGRDEWLSDTEGGHRIGHVVEEGMPLHGIEGPTSPTDALRPAESSASMWWGGAQGPPPATADERREEKKREDRAEARARLAIGLKRYLFDKRKEGLLSAQGARVLSDACDAAIQNAERPLVSFFSRV